MKKAIEKLGLHLTVLLFKAGADDQAYDEIIESLERAKERSRNAPKDPSKEEHETKRSVQAGSIRLLAGGAFNTPEHSC